MTSGKSAPMRSRLTSAVLAALAWLLLPPDGARAEGLRGGAILPGWALEGGGRMAALRIDLAPGWKTYWRAPGEGGIPPLFDWSGSRNLGAVQLHWPLPQVFETNGIRAIGYGDGLLLPIEVHPSDPGAPVVLALAVDIGVCADICQPATLVLGPVVLDAGDAAPDPAIRAALDARPLDGRAAGVSDLRCRAEPATAGLRLVAEVTAPPLGAAETVVIEADAPGVWVDQALTERNGDVLVATAAVHDIGGAGIVLDRRAITITVLAEGRGYEVRGCPSE